MQKGDTANLPKGWEIKKLGEICEIKGRIGYRGYTTNDLVNKGEGAITLSPSNIQNNKFNTNECTYISWFKYEESPEIMVFEGDILFVKTGSTYGKVALVENLLEKATINPQFVVLKNIKCLNKFLYYSLTTIEFKAKVEKIIGGAATPTLSQTNLAKQTIPVPPLHEQQQIVSTLDECFTAIDKAKANTEQNLKNAKDLFESYLQGVFENENWGKIKLSNITSDITDGDHLPPPKSKEGFPFITISNINKTTYKIDFSDTFKVSQSYYDNLKQNRKPIKGDVLYTVTGSYGIPVLIEDDYPFCFQRHIGLIRPGNKLNSKLLFYWILSPQAISQANETAIGTAQKTVSLKSLRNFDFPNIPLVEQQTIVHQLDALRTETQKLEAVYQKKIANLDELKKSILQKAFMGKLSATMECISYS